MSIWVRKLDQAGNDNVTDIDPAAFPSVKSIEDYLTLQKQTILGYLVEYYAGLTQSSKYKGYIFNERTSSLAGPFYHE